jgi:glutathione S-transferase
MIALYDMSLSGNCHKVGLLSSVLSLPYQTHAVNLLGGEQRRPDYLRFNPFGQVPVLDDDDLIIRDSQAILVYLAKRYGGPQWWPDDAYRLAQIAEKVLYIIDHHLENQDWLVGDTLFIADIAAYPYLALAPEGDIGIYVNIVAWFQRIRALPGYVAMPGIWQP